MMWGDRDGVRENIPRFCAECEYYDTDDNVCKSDIDQFHRCIQHMDDENKAGPIPKERQPIAYGLLLSATEYKKFADALEDEEVSTTIRAMGQKFLRRAVVFRAMPQEGD